MQRAGQDCTGAERQRRRAEIRHPAPSQGEADKADRGANQRADHRKHPVRAHEIFGNRALRMRHRQPGQKSNRGFEIVEPFLHGGCLENRSSLRAPARLV